MHHNIKNGIQRAFSNKTQLNWQIDSILFLSALAVTASSLYFLFFPGGYQGGRNPSYNAVVLFNRTEWDLIHTWSGIFMIFIAVIHFLLHWRWFLRMGSRLILQLRGKAKPLNRNAWINLITDATIAVSFFAAALSGIYFLFVPSGRTADPMFLFSRTTWDLLHTWSGILMIIAIVIHFLIHWRWIINVARRMIHPVNACQKTPSKLTGQPGLSEE